MQRVLFHKSHDIENKLLIIIHVDKMSVQKETSFSQTKPRPFLEPFTLETHKKQKVTSWCTFTKDNIAKYKSK